MKAAPQLVNEARRCEALHSLQILDTAPESRFDRLTRLAQQLFQVEIALVSLVDEDRQWFKSRQGLEASETPRSISFCGHAIEQDRVFVIEDALSDDRFVDNPLVTDGPRIRFYAGCPLKGPGGQLLGTLCVIDSQPRQFDDQDRDALRVLAELVEAELREPVNVPQRLSEDSWLKRKLAALKRARKRISHRVFALPAALAIAALVLALAGMWDRAQMGAKLDSERQAAYHDAGLVLGEMENAINARLHMVYALSGQIHADPQVNDAEFQRFASQLAHQVSHIRSLQFAPDGVVTHVWPPEGNSAAIGHDLLADPKRRAAAENAIETRSIWLTGPINLIQGGQALIGRLPVFLPSSGSEVFWGFVTILIDIRGLLDEQGVFSPADDYDHALRFTSENGRPARTMGDVQLFDDEHLSIPVPMPGVEWTLAVAPSGGWDANWSGRQAFWIMALLVAPLVGLMVFWLLRLPDQTRATIRRAVEELESSQARFRDAIQALPAGFVIFDREDRLSSCNERYRELYAATRPRLQVGRRFEDILDYAVNVGQFDVVKNADDKTRANFIEVIMQRHRLPSSAFDQKLSDGRWVRVVEQRMRDGGTVSFHVDVSDQKANTQALVEARRKAEQANQAKSTFLATVSHEVRTPLNGVIGLLSVLRGDRSLNKEQANYVKTASNSAHHLLGLLNEILDISKMEADKLELEAEDFELSVLVDGAVDLVRAQAESKGLTLDVEWDVCLRACALTGDEARLRQILLNLLSNAIKFTDAGSVTLKLSINGRIEKRVPLCIEVIDTGIGFDPAQSERLFAPFDQLDADADRKFSGTGLGLAISKRLVELMGGSIRADGKLGQGACFRIDLNLPLGQAPHTDETTSAISPVELPIMLGWPGVRVLLAEDSPTNQLVIRAMLENTGYELDVVNNGREALDAVTSKRYDLVLMDVFMPEMDGVSATRALRADHPRDALPVIALTANAMQGDKERFLEAGMNDHLTKPLERKVLLACLHRWLAPRMGSRSNRLVTEEANHDG